MMDRLTPQQSRAAAVMIQAFRPDWHRPGIEDALHECRELASGADVVRAALAAAEDPSNRTPAVIPMEGAHWKAAASAPRHPEPDANDRCSVCFERRSKCIRMWSDDHAFDSIAEQRRRKAERLEREGQAHG